MATSVSTFVQHVTAQLGRHEMPLGSNHTEYGAEFGWNNVSWCAEFGWDMYHDVGVALPVKSAACVAVWDYCATHGLAYASTNCVPGDSLIRTWQHLDRARLDPAQTHYQIVVGVHWSAGKKYLDLIGGNQGPGVVSRDTVQAGDVSVLGGLAFHRLFDTPWTAPPAQATQDHRLPAPKSHKYPQAFLSLGSHGDLVVALQQHLQAHGFYRGFRVDGAFGPNTLAAVVAFQKHTWPSDSHQWDGIVGVNTYRALGF